MKIFSFQNLTYAYPGTKSPVMTDFNLEIQAGSMTSILGPNGAGKTTLLYLALGWIQPQSGRILMDGKPLETYGRREMGQWISLVPQTESVAFDYSLLDYVMLGRAPYLQPLAMPSDVDHKIASDALQRVGLGDLQERSVLSISGGEHQLVLMARSLAQHPKILLLDEPTSHLDLSNKGRLAHLLSDLAASGVTIVFTTHEPDFAANLAEQVVLIRKGKVVKMGTQAEVMTSEALSDLYQSPLDVRMVDNHRVVLWR